ncbi:MAG: Dam family site-specific DNA-(adenine-N6)-methyltransferase [Gammaproteobacteria bacterium]|nr:Dam family site-specific DNA-(adenine-N6)-methyltransferase [Gammaproteobacteria bacterium]
MAADKNPKASPYTRPFLKWAGGKYRLVERIRSHLPAGSRLIEPFVGSGAVFLNLEFNDYLLADINPDLIGLYQLVQAEGEDFIARLRPYFDPARNTPEHYYATRERFNACTDPEERSALFVYLNRHGYNGLCRYNSEGGFNVPFGRYKKIYFPEKELQHFHRHSQRARFLCADFGEVMKQARKGSVIYCDPPYAPLSRTASFTAYASAKHGQFGASEQERLAELAARAASKGVPVLLSNHDNEYTRRVYAEASLASFPVRRTISCDSSRRGHAAELLALYRP